MQIFVRTVLLSVHIGWAALFSLGPQSCHAQDSMGSFSASDGTTDQAAVESGQTVKNSSAETSGDSGQPTSPRPRRPLPTGSNLLPSPVTFSRQPEMPDELLGLDQRTRQIMPAQTPNAAHAATSEPSATDGSDEQEVLRLTNEVRASAGLPPLAWNEDLANAARHHAADMEADGYFDHDTYDRINGQLVRICSAQERMGLFSPVGAGENIAHGQRTPDEVMQTWLASPPHRRGILRTDISTIGVGKVGKNWVQNFGW